MSSLDFNLTERVDAYKRDRADRQRKMINRIKNEEQRKKRAEAATYSLLDKQRKQEKLRLLKEIQQQLLIRKQKLIEFKRTGGISLQEELVPYPIAKAEADSDRVVLPQSIIEKLIQQNALENNYRKENQPLTFELSLYKKVVNVNSNDDDEIARNGNLIGKTYCGVDEFTADEGRVGIPPKTALSLTKDFGVGILAKDCVVVVKYVILPTYSRYFMQLQPKGDGFFVKNSKKNGGKDDVTEEVVNIDIKSALENTLQFHFVISIGDWIPVVQNGQKYVLVVKDIRPVVESGSQLRDDIHPSKEVVDTNMNDRNDVTDELDSNDLDLAIADSLDVNEIELEDDAYIVLNTDIEVDIMPSENVQEKLANEAEYQKLRESFILKLEKQVKKYEIAIAETVNEKGKRNSEESDVITFRVRFPTGKSLTQKFNTTTYLSGLLDWVYYEMSKQITTGSDSSQLLDKIKLEPFLLSEMYPFYLMHPWPVGNLKQNIDDNEANKTLKELGLINRGYTLNAFWKHNKGTDKSDANTESKNKEAENKIVAEDDNEWTAAAQALENGLQNRPTESISITSHADISKATAETGNVEDIVDCYTSLINIGINATVAEEVSRKYSKEVKELITMGFESRLEEVAQLLLRYKGRVVRVANALFENS